MVERQGVEAFMEGEAGLDDVVDRREQDSEEIISLLIDSMEDEADELRDLDINDDFDREQFMLKLATTVTGIKKMLEQIDDQKTSGIQAQLDEVSGQLQSLGL